MPAATPGEASPGASGTWARPFGIAAVATLLCAGYALAGDARTEPIKIAVFEFELEDMSAAGGTGASPDEGGRPLAFQEGNMEPKIETLVIVGCGALLTLCMAEICWTALVEGSRLW